MDFNIRCLDSEIQQASSTSRVEGEDWGGGGELSLEGTLDVTLFSFLKNIDTCNFLNIFIPP